MHFIYRLFTSRAHTHTHTDKSKTFGMSLRELVDAECGGANALMRMGGHVLQDAARKDDGIAGPSGAAFANRTIPGQLNEHQMVNEFLGQIAPAPQTFRMDALLQEMREIDAHNFQPPVLCARPVIDEVSSSNGGTWANEFTQGAKPQGADAETLRQISEQV